jgi:DNA-binding MarR family transcriptional regulator
MNDATMEARILAALRHGPLYEGLIPLVVDAKPSDVRRLLDRLEARGQANRDGATWSAKA